MRFGKPAVSGIRSHSSLRHWPLYFVFIFAAYSAVLLVYAIDNWRHMRQDAIDHFVSDNQRRAQALGDISAGYLRDTARAHANLQEIHAYLQNRDLGMSPRYGLNLSLAIVEDKFKQLSEQFAARWNTSPPRLVMYSDAGIKLADTHPAMSEDPLPSIDSAAAIMNVDIRGGNIEISAPVLHKGKRDGVVVSYLPLSFFYRHLMPPPVSSGYLEILLSSAGDLLPGRELDASFSPAQLRRLASLEMQSVISLEELGADDGNDGAIHQTLITASSIPGIPVILVSFIPKELIYGPIHSHHVVIGACALLIFMVFGAFKMERMYLETARLEQDKLVADQQRALTEFRNVELSAEIRRRTQAEIQLAESKERWELAIAGTNDGIWDWNMRTGDLFLSTRWKSMLGYADTDLHNHFDTWDKLAHPEDKPRVLEDLGRHLRAESGYFMCEHRLLCKDGSYKWILARGRALFDENGLAVRMAGSHTDISEQRAAQDRIADRNAQLDAIFSLSPDGFVAFDARHRVKHLNPAFVNMTGYSAADIVGLDEDAFSAHLAGDCLPATPFMGVAALRKAEETLMAATRGTKATLQRQLIELARGNKRVIDLKLRLADAATVSQILYLRDVTHEVEVDRMKSEFLSHAAHELRTPMASIFGYSELLMSRDFDAETRKEMLQTIHKQTAWLIEIINELLDIARIESRRGKDFRIESVPLAAVLVDTLSVMQIDATRWPLKIDVPDILPPVRADAAKLRQVLTNVLGNAMKYSPDGGEIMIAWVSRTVGDRPMAGLSITDHGIGMTEEQVARACERFYRADVSGNVPGTGLGLAIVKEVVELLGGKVEIRSVPQRGTTVTLLLPVFR